MENIQLNQTNKDNKIDRKKGLIYLVISAFCFSFSGIFVKGVEASGADVVFWRALFGVILVLLWVYGTSQVKKQLKISWSMVFIAGLAVICTTTFLMSFKYTSVANVAIIYAACPLIAGFLGRVILAENFSIKQIIFCLLALTGIVVVMRGSLGTINIYGDTLAIIMSATLALIIVLFRKYPNTASGGVNVYSCITLVAIFFFIGDPISVPVHEILILALFALFFIVAYVTLQEGSKLLPPALTSLLSILETPLAPVWAWLFLSEFPTASTLIGGAIILVAVMLAVLETDKKV